jgi:hypothetical protein
MLKEYDELINFETIKDFYDFLRGDSKYHFIQNKLSEKDAFGVIYYLQEVMNIFPDNIEQCKNCGELYDMDNNGCINFCEYCGEMGCEGREDENLDCGEDCNLEVVK